MTKKKRKDIVDIYYIDIYDIYLVVANEYTTLEQLQKVYTYVDGDELDNRIMKAECVTATCIDRKTDSFVILVKYNGDKSHKNRDKKLNFINTCSHEATHVALDIYEAINQKICFCTPEPFCYLQAKVTEYIYTTLSK